MIRIDNPLVLIEWEDSAQPTPGWQYISDFTCGSVVLCASVGWLLHDGKDMKAIAQNIGHTKTPQSDQASGVIRIPTRSIKRMVRLRKPT